MRRKEKSIKGDDPDARISTASGIARKMDFHVRAHDHGRARVLVAPIGSIGGHCYSRTLAEFESLSPVAVKLPSIVEHRRIDLHFAKHAPDDAWDARAPAKRRTWDEFQLHRRIVAMVGVAECETLDEIDEIGDELKALRRRHETSILDWRCLVFCPHAELEEAIVRVRGFHCILLGDGERGRGTTHHDDVVDFGALRPQIEAVLEDVASYLYLALDSRRHEFSEMKAEKMPLLRTPLDKEMTSSFGGEDGRQPRKRCLARMNKHLGDLCLILGRLSDAFKYYVTSADQSKSINDWLWMGGAIEGQCNTAIRAMHENKVSMTTKTMAKTKKKGKENFMTNEELVKGYQNALTQYSKFREAAVMEAECSFSASRHLAFLKKKIEAAEILQELVYIRIASSEEEKVNMFEAMGQLFRDLGYSRKACFYYRLAAMHSVKQAVTSPNWNKAYHFLIKSLKDISVTVGEKKKIQRGWPLVQNRLLHELIYVAKKLNKVEAALNYSLLTLDSLYTHLSNSELKRMTTDIENLARQLPLNVDDNALTPLQVIPTIKSLIPCELPRPQRPFSTTQNNQRHHGPFIFSSLKRTPRPKEAVSVYWVKDCVAEVAVELYNPLPFEIKVEKMKVLTSGNKFEAFPSSVTLQPNSDPHRVVLVGSPQEPGQLQITGYSAKVFGVESQILINCSTEICVTPSLPLLRAFPLSSSAASPSPNARRPLSAGDALPNASARSPVIDRLRNHLRVGSQVLFDGEETTIRLKIENNGEEEINNLNLNLTINNQEDKDLVTWSIVSKTNAFLPLRRRQPAQININLRGHYPFARVNLSSSSSKRHTVDGDVMMTTQEEKSSPTTSPLTRVKQKMKSVITKHSSPPPSPQILRNKEKAKSKFKKLFTRRSRYSTLQQKNDDSPTTNRRLLDLTEMPAPCCCQVEAWFQYGGGESVTWYREMACILDVAVCPVLLVSGLELALVKYRQGVCEVKMKIQNVSDIQLEVRCDVQEKGGDMTPPFLLRPLDQDSVSALVPRCENVVVDDYGVWLRDLILIKWRQMGGLKLLGAIRLPHFGLDCDMVRLLKPDPLQINCRLDGDCVHVGKAVELSVEFINNNSRAATNVHSFALDWKEAESEQEDLVTPHHAWIGALDGIVPQLKSTESFIHKCHVVFLKEGKYDLKCSCHDDEKTSFHTTPLTLHAQSIN